ncbi:bifunctional UDP-N-acetylmuramoyl-tripeptide:D-alanyl-D-alanine ligase/alanine racemase [Fulvivirga sp. M361]|uniref:bifunctional UDP-N-acetylmuramoyl-tripeptide:D-alanyl-D-alanine ligase/alanine racemase n=1 Tax=Fulvivirga sp. M361 TaxID=2594266 RepID=UPI00117B1C61|nr:bifunctional UDP-N-acetylmuramoyl-tripeptide:D-alanyl-D-alanine ligase/alanine racemase [Fulvivirga sp. M361]TRX61400.1 bifunctional UDP-N-acetylmuramoyl-tripeptide:D-alanyl-D-alanine ligase/alanine racemase [Fulvivirga sp. M361]
MILFGQLPQLTEGEFLNFDRDIAIKYLVTDSRKSTPLEGSVFFAIPGLHHDGHDYVTNLYEKGVRNFVVQRPVSLPDHANVFCARNVLTALQRLAAFHRSEFDLPVIGVTGSNGKTIVKEWLYRLFSPVRNVVKSPRSYNSQLGVPLSVWQIEEGHEVAIFEAGISQTGEMTHLQKIIAPSIGIFTNIGPAHDEGFVSHEQKVAEKALLFKSAEVVVYCKDHTLIDAELSPRGFTWGRHQNSDVRITREEDHLVSVDCNGRSYDFHLPFKDKPSVENVMHCITCLLYFDIGADIIQAGLERLEGVKMRLELKKGTHNCYLVDDTYNNDLAGLYTALDFLEHQGKREKKVVILSDILQSGSDHEPLYTQVAEMLAAFKIDRFIGVGEQIGKCRDKFPPNACFYTTTDELMAGISSHQFQDEAILVKGARNFRFERLVKLLEEKIHGTVLEVNLDALTKNLNFYRTQAGDNTKMMVMVKAFAYGSGGFEIANLLQYHQVDYLGVAYADEGVTLRQQGIRLPIMVMNPSMESFEKLKTYQLEPEVYSISILGKLLDFIGEEPIGIHIKLDTGMRRLGFDTSTINELISILKTHPNLEVKSIFSHLAGSDSDVHNSFSHQQAGAFNELSQMIIRQLKINPVRHLVNSSGILRFPEYHFDMVRLGIGLYGLESNGLRQDDLQLIGTLKTVISQIKTVEPGDTIGYGRRGVAQEKITIATIAIGYADGFPRILSDGVGEVWINGSRAPVVGNVCMDMTMVNVTGIDVQEGDEVEVFGDNISIRELADKTSTIPYEILTNVSQRVKRVYYSE